MKQEARWTKKDDNIQDLLEKAVPKGVSAVDDIDFADIIAELCTISSKPIVVLIDEVDQAGNNDGFVKFLGGLRNMYLKKSTQPTFQSVILAGVYDIKNLKHTIRPEDQHQYNSPWNIAVPFDVDMSLPAKGIAKMLLEYKADHTLSFDEIAVADCIHDYTSGHPFLVSRICQIIATEKLQWDRQGVLKAVNIILVERNTLFDNMTKKLDDYPELKQMLKGIIFSGNAKTYNPDEKHIQIASMLNYIVNKNGKVAIACRIMETRLYNLFISELEESPSYMQGQIDKQHFIHDGVIDMAHLLERFAVHVIQTFSMDKDHAFLENNGRQIFLTYLRPIINGIGNYYIEAETRDFERTDIIVDYLGKQYVIELKIWRGNAYNERGEEQLAKYLNHYNIKTGYLVSFCFNKEKKTGLLPPITIGSKTLIEVVV